MVGSDCPGAADHCPYAVSQITLNILIKFSIDSGCKADAKESRHYGQMLYRHREPPRQLAHECQG